MRRAGAFAALLTFAAVLALTAAGEPAPAPPAPAAENGRLAGLPAELQRVLTRLEEAGAKVHSLQADVQYERAIELLDEKQKASGTLEFLKPNLLHLKLGKPRDEEVYSDGNRWWIVSHGERQVEVYKADSSSEGAAEAAFLTLGIGQSVTRLLDSYDVTLKDGAAGKSPGKDQQAPVRHRLRFVPRPGSAPAHFSAVEAVVPEDTWLPTDLVLYESDGEIVHHFHLAKVRLNVELKPEQFVCRPPRGYAMIEPAAGLEPQ
jgi:outer membrane lipoprotein-sorting protein